jgi:hypothetical protein
MLDQFTLDTFAPRAGETFRLHAEGAAPFDLVLASVREIPVSGWRPDDAAEHRTPFSLVFHGPPQFVLPQAIYRFEHDGLGAFEMFIVPIARDAQAVSYEAVFS